MAHEFKVTYTVEFADTDMAGIAHFSAFFRYMEAAEHAFYRSLGFSVYVCDKDGVAGWPRVSARCDFRSPLRFEDVVEVHLLVRQRAAKSIAYDFVFNKLNAEPPLQVAHGSMTVVYAVREHGQAQMRAVDIPPQIAGKIDTAPVELLKGDSA